MYIIVDNRENEKIKSQCKNYFTNFSFKTINVGDYQVYINDVLRLIIERKTWKDLAESIKDGRNRTQEKKMDLMIQYRPIRILYIIEGRTPSPDGKRGISRNALYGQLRAFALRGKPYIFSKNVEETLQTIESLAQKALSIHFDELNEDFVNDVIEISKNYSETEKQFAEDLLIKEVDDIKFGASDEDIKIKMLLCFSGITEKNVHSFIDVNIHNFYFNRADYFDKIDNAKYESGRRLAKTIREKIKYQSPKAIDLLRVIPSFSNRRINAILEVCSFENLADFDISDIKINNRRLGNKLNEQLHKYIYITQ